MVNSSLKVVTGIFLRKIPLKLLQGFEKVASLTSCARSFRMLYCFIKSNCFIIKCFKMIPTAWDLTKGLIKFKTILLIWNFPNRSAFLNFFGVVSGIAYKAFLLVLFSLFTSRCCFWIDFINRYSERVRPASDCLFWTLREMFSSRLFLLWSFVCVSMPPCPFENMIMLEISMHMESCSSATKNIISPLPKSIWPPNSAGWWLTRRSSHPKIHMILQLCGLAGHVTDLMLQFLISACTRSMITK